jgi:hypothetical protein
VNRPPEPQPYVPAAAGADAPAPDAAPIPLARLLQDTAPKVKEIGGRQNGLDPTRYGDWEKNGRCIDF